jgi:hypothetical protein
MTLFGSRNRQAPQESSTTDELAAFKAQVHQTITDAGERIPGGRVHAQNVLRDLGLSGNYGVVNVASVPATKKIIAGFDAEFTVTATVPERVADQIDGFTDGDVVEAVRAMISVGKVDQRPYQVPQEVWDTLTISVDRVDLESIDAE